MIFLKLYLRVRHVLVGAGAVAGVEADEGRHAALAVCEWKVVQLDGNRKCSIMVGRLSTVVITSNHGCQMAIARFFMCLALRASGLWLRYAAKFDPFLSLDCAELNFAV